MFSAADSIGSRLKAWNTNPMRSRRRRVSSLSDRVARSTSPTSTRPLVSVSSPAMQCMRVDLPEPDGPMMAVKRPAGMARLDLVEGPHRGVAAAVDLGGGDGPDGRHRLVRRVPHRRLGRRHHVVCSHGFDGTDGRTQGEWSGPASAGWGWPHPGPAAPPARRPAPRRSLSSPDPSPLSVTCGRQWVAPRCVAPASYRGRTTAMGLMDKVKSDARSAQRQGRPAASTRRATSSTTRPAASTPPTSTRPRTPPRTASTSSTARAATAARLTPSGRGGRRRRRRQPAP